jgi:hypothetical protein
MQNSATELAILRRFDESAPGFVSKVYCAIYTTRLSYQLLQVCRFLHAAIQVRPPHVQFHEQTSSHLQHRQYTVSTEMRFYGVRLSL